MTSNAEHSLLDVMINAYIEASPLSNPFDHLEEILDLVQDTEFTLPVRKIILKSLLYYSGNNNLSSEYVKEIKKLDTDMFPDYKDINFLNSPEGVIEQYRKVKQYHVIDYVLSVFSKFNKHHLDKYMSYYLAEIILLYINNKIIKEDLYYLWDNILKSKNKVDIVGIFNGLYNVNITNTHFKVISKLILSNKDIIEDIASDWFLFMQDHSNIEEVELGKTFDLIISIDINK